MKYVQQDDKTFIPFEGTADVLYKLPVNIYTVESHPMRGMFLVVYDKNFKIDEPKLYGEYPKKLNKIVNSFEHMNRNMGVIMSGDKGLGKSLSAKMLCNKFLEKDYPIILCDKYNKGLASLLHDIEQTCIVFFDEFDKIFTYESELNNQESDKPQEQFLSLFDGTDNNKKMFIVTCNDIFKLNSYFINRPGRFHYNISFEYPTKDEVREYMQDNLIDEYHNEIGEIVKFSERVDLNYDSLRAIAFEINLGVPFKEAIADLNILNTRDTDYKITIHFVGGETSEWVTDELDISDVDNIGARYGGFWCDMLEAYISIVINHKDIKYDYVRHCYALDGKDCKLMCNTSDKDTQEKFKKLQVEYVTFKRNSTKLSYHYLI